jgi:hypothetical protein
MINRFGKPDRLRSLEGARLGGVGRTLNRSGSLIMPINAGMISRAKDTTTTRNKLKTT